MFQSTLITGALAVACASCTAGVDFHVADYGSDSNPGTRAKPFATLERARDAVRELDVRRHPPDGGVTVWLKGGTYVREATFELTERDSGTKACPVVYRSYEGEQARLVGGREVRRFSAVTDRAVLERLDEAARAHVRQADLRAEGISDFGKLTARGFGRPGRPAALELFFRGAPMQLARWPNGEWAMTAGVPDGPNGGRFNYEGDRPGRWTESKDVWVHGYWTWPWADSHEKVASIDIAKREIGTEPPHGVYGYQAHKRYYALNILEELDQPGEFYVDRDSGILYFWPPDRIRRSDAWVSVMEAPLVKVSAASHVTLRGLALECCRGTAVEIVDCANVQVAGCVVRNVGGTGIIVKGGRSSGVLSCDISEIGDTGIVLDGGDRRTLTAASNYAVNNHLRRFGRWVRTYRPAILVSGVGNRVAHNLIHDAPHSAIILSGNDHVVEFNDIHHVCNETGDAGAFYMGRDWTQRGNAVRHNYFHELGSYEDRHSAHGFSETMAVYLDDWTSGTLVYGNIFYRANRAVMIGGGRDNTVENNVFIECSPAIHVDARGLGWAKNYFDGTTTTLFDRFRDVNADRPPYSTRYPRLATLLEDEPAVPKGNVIARNIHTGGKWLDLHGMQGGWVTFQDNLTEGDAGFVNAEARDFRLRPDSPAFRLGFTPIPVETIGLYQDEFRTRQVDGGGHP